MRNPPRTLQNSIFEPLYFHAEELHFQPNMPITQSSSSSSSSSSDDLISLTPLSSIFAPPFTQATMKRAAATVFNANTSKESCSDVSATEFARSITTTTEYAHTQHGLPSTCDAGMCSPSGSFGAITPTSASICAPIRTHSASDVGNPDDGSVASKLLSSIPKSISSPSLLACCKESARETPYQKSLKLKTMKLEFCAEELGSESSEGSLHGGDYFTNNNIFDGLDKMSFSQSTRDFSAEHQKSEGNSAKLISVRSSPNLGCSSLVSKVTSPTKERSFPPPLSHTLPRSTSLDSFSYSLRASREDGRFVLKEFKVPCRQYFQASRKDGRLTLQRLISTDEDSESMPTTDEAHINQRRESQEDDNVGVYAEVCGDVGASEQVEVESAKADKVEVESAKNTANLVGGLEVCTRMKGSKKSVDDKCLLMVKLLSNGDSNSSGGELNEDKNSFMSLGAANSTKMKSDFKAAKRKTASKVLCIRSSSNRHLRSSSSIRHSLLHLPGKSWPNSKIGHEIGKGPSSTLISKDHHESAEECLMENASKWSCEEENWKAEKSGVMESLTMGTKSMNMGVRPIGSDCSHELIHGVFFDVKCCFSKSSLHFGVHCKEIFHRNLAKGALVKLHCVA